MKSQHSDNHNEKYRSLLQGLLAPIRGAHLTPQQIEIDCPAIVATAWQELLAEYPEVESDDSAFSPEALIESLDGILGRRSEAMVGNQPAPPEIALSNWLQGLLETLQSIDPQAVDIAGLKAEGFDNRAISEGLDMGLRLVNRIVGDIKNPPLASSENNEPETEDTVPC